MARAEAESAQAAPGDASEIVISLAVKPIAIVLLAGLILRLALATLPGFGVDLGSFRAWSLQLASNGPWDFYDTGFFADYAPGYLYVLWFIGTANRFLQFDAGQFDYVLKLPAVFADLASAFLLYRLLEGQRPLARLAGPALYLLFPATLLIGPVWGQVDSILALFLLLTVYYVSRGRPVRGAVAFTVGFLVKPQAVAALPFLAFWYLKNFPLAMVIRASAIALGVGLLLIIPFFPDNPWGIVNRLADATNIETYRVNSFWAYNFWGLFDLFKPDDLEYLGFTYRVWGFFLFAVAMALVILAFWRSRGDNAGALALGTALSVLVFYLFLTRMHERYLFPFFLPFLAAALLTQSRLLWATFIGLGVIHFFNLYYVYSYYPFYLPSDGVSVEPFARPLFDWIADRVFLLSLLSTLAFPLLLLVGYGLAQRRPPDPEPT
jgi:dolichyl-phosphate-mannose-protein mannosyltransferase